MPRWIGRLIALLAVLGTTLGTAGIAHAYVAGQDRLAFARFDGTSASVQTMAYDGSAPKVPVKANGATIPRFVAASLSADGTKLIYARLPNPNFSDLYVKTIGGGTKRLTRTPTITETSPAWSPNGKRIAFTRVAATGPVPAFGSGHARLRPRGPSTALGDAYTMSTTSLGSRRVTTDTQVWGRVVYGPNKTLVVSRLAHVSLDLYSVPVRGGKYHRLTHTGETYNAVDLLLLRVA